MRDAAGESPEGNTEVTMCEMSWLTVLLVLAGALWAAISLSAIVAIVQLAPSRPSFHTYADLTEAILWPVILMVTLVAVLLETILSALGPPRK